MKRQRQIKHVFLWIITSILMSSLTACGGAGGGSANVSSSGGIMTWLDQPPRPQGIVLPLAPYKLKAHARNETGGGVNQITFLVNSIALGSVPVDSSQPVAYAEFNWNPAAPGEYLIQAQAASGGGTSLSEIARVCVVSENASDASACGVLAKNGDKVSGGKVTVTPQGNQAVEFKFGGNPDPIYVGTCTEGEPQLLNLEGYASDITGAIEVDVIAMLKNSAGKQQELGIIPMQAAGKNGYTASYDLSKVDPDILEDNQGSLVLTMNLLNDQKTFYATSPERTITVIPCSMRAKKSFDVKMGASPNPVYLGQCKKGEAQTVNIEGAVLDASVSGEVDLNLTLVNYIGQRQELPHQMMTPSGNNAYTAKVDVRNVDAKMLEYQKGTLVYSLNLLGTKNEVLATSAEQSIVAVPCVYTALQQGDQQPEQQPEQPEQPQPKQPQEPPAPMDTTPPSVKASPSSQVIYFDTYGKGCDPSNPTSVTISASVSDESDLKTPTLFWYYASKGDPYSAAQVGMSGGGSSWSATIVPDHGNDTIAYWVEAYDIYGNHAQSQGANTVSVSECKAGE